MGVVKSIAKTVRYAADELKAESVRYRSDVLQVSVPDGFKDSRSTLCLFAHYSPDGQVAAYVFEYLECLMDAGCSVMLISTSPTIGEVSLQHLLRMGVSVMLRRNVGYDFGSWCSAIRVLPAVEKRYKTIMFVNDSVYGPFSDLSKIIGEMDARSLDVWALTSSHECKHHLQSYFWAISNEGLRSGFFEFFWRKYYKYYSHRKRVIDLYELGIKRIAEDNFGLTTGAFIDADKIGARIVNRPALEKFNPMHHAAMEMVQHLDFPFVKRELLARDPFGLQKASALESMLSSKNPDMWRLVREHHLSEKGGKKPINWNNWHEFNK